MQRNITLGHLNISDQGKKYVLEALNTNRLSRGKFTEKLEKNFASLHETEHAIFMNSGTSALQVSLAALKEVHGYSDYDEVIVPAMTFIASSNVIIQNNLKPVFVDVKSDTFNIDVSKIEAKITPKTRCIMPVHLFGLAADMIPITELAKAYKLQILEDSCEAMFATDNGKSVGSFGDLACFSTYVAHFIVGGVGGIITTNDTYLAELCRSFMAHGRDSIYLSIDDDDDKGDKLQGIIERRYSFERVGYSYRATELEAGVALSELDRWKENITIRRHNAAYLTKLLQPLKHLIQLPFIPENKTHSYMMYAAVLHDSVNRSDFLLFLEENGIETRYLLPLLSQPIYKRLFPGEDDINPVAKHLAAQGFFVGIHQGLSNKDIEYIADVAFEYFKGYV